MPLFDIKIIQLLDEATRKADNNALIIDNSGGPVREFDAKIIFIVQINSATKSAPIKQTKIAFRIIDYYAAKAVSALSKGRLVTTAAINNNNAKMFELSKSLQAASDQHGWSYANLGEQTFVHLSYKDILNRWRSEYYSVAPVSGSAALSEAEGESTFRLADKLPRMYLSQMTVDMITALIDKKLDTAGR